MGCRTWVIVLVIVVCGISRATADEAEDRAVAVIEKLGGKVTRDETKPSKPVVGVSLVFFQATDEDLKELIPL
jgi:internalin A